MNDLSQGQKEEICLLYAGTYSRGNSRGIYHFRFNMANGELQPLGVAGEADNPSYLAIDVKKGRLYAVNEVAEFAGRPGGGVCAFAIEPSTGDLSFISQTHNHGAGPCYLSLDHSGRYLLVANYSGGNVTVILVSDDGVLNEPIDTIAHTGSRLHPKRQKRPHPHSIVLDPANKYAFVPDLGLDRVLQYRFDRVTGRLVANRRPWVEVEAGSGPRHLVFHPEGRFAYVINELSSTITAYVYDPNQGNLELLQSISTLPDDYFGSNLAADLHVTPSGKFLLGSNRSHDSIAFYAIDPNSGWLTLVDFVPTQGRTPRGFVIDPSGTFALVANQDSHTIMIFRIDEEQGRIFSTGNGVHIPDPVCLKFAAEETS